MPQLFNVLQGGDEPRRATPCAAGGGLAVRPAPSRPHQGEPGITGLWQVEARDNPSFSAYRRLDLFYVDNWSVSLDLVIILATVEQVAAKAVRTVLRKRPNESNVTTVDPGAAGIEAGDRAA